MARLNDYPSFGKGKNVSLPEWLHSLLKHQVKLWDQQYASTGRLPFPDELIKLIDPDHPSLPSDIKRQLATASASTAYKIGDLMRLNSTYRRPMMDIAVQITQLDVNANSCTLKVIESNNSNHEVGSEKSATLNGTYGLYSTFEPYNPSETTLNELNNSVEPFVQHIENLEPKEQMEPNEPSLPFKSGDTVSTLNKIGPYQYLGIFWEYEKDENGEETNKYKWECKLLDIYMCAVRVPPEDVTPYRGTIPFKYRKDMTHSEAYKLMQLNSQS